MSDTQKETRRIDFHLRADAEYERLRDAVHHYFRKRCEAEFEKSSSSVATGERYMQVIVDTVAQCFALATALMLTVGETTRDVEMLADDCHLVFDQQLALSLVQCIETLPTSPPPEKRFS